MRLSVLVEADVAKVEIGGIVVKDDEVVFEDIGARAVKPDKLVTLSTHQEFFLFLYQPIPLNKINCYS